MLFIPTPEILELSANFSVNMPYGGGTVTKTFTIPDGKTYVGAGLKSMTFDKIGGARSTSFSLSGNTLTATIDCSGNWNTTVSGTLTLNVFVN